MKKNNQKVKNKAQDATEEVKDEVANQPKKHYKTEEVTLIDQNNFLIGQRPYRLVLDHREAFNPEALGERYSEILNRYDYIVGDWGYEQLRLKGFFKDTHKKTGQELKISTLEDYLYEFCNFGCAYFVIEKVGSSNEKPKKNSQPRKKTSKEMPKQAHISEKKFNVREQAAKPKKLVKNQPSKEKPKVAPKKDKGSDDASRHFKIRQKEQSE